MIAIQVYVNVFVLAGLALMFFIIGFIFRKNQLNSLHKKIVDLEREMLSCHAEILQLQRDKIDLIKSITEPPIPVISISSGKEERSAEKMPDVTSRKKLLGNSAILKQQAGG